MKPNFCIQVSRNPKTGFYIITSIEGPLTKDLPSKYFSKNGPVYFQNNKIKIVSNLRNHIAVTFGILNENLLEENRKYSPSYFNTAGKILLKASLIISECEDKKDWLTRKFEF